MNTNIPLMVKIPADYEHYGSFIPLNSIEFTLDSDNKFIRYAWKISDKDEDDKIANFESVDGQIVNIESLHCRSYEELIVQLQLNNALFGGIDDNEIAVSGNASEIEKEVMALRCENKLLKAKLQRLASILEK